MGEIEKRWLAGDSAGVIARDLDLTRGQVIGRIHRAGLSGARITSRTLKPGAPDPRLNAAQKYVNELRRLDAKARREYQAARSEGFGHADAIEIAEDASTQDRGEQPRLSRFA